MRDYVRYSKEFEDVFPPELPDGLPPARGVGHSIPIEPGALHLRFDLCTG